MERLTKRLSSGVVSWNYSNDCYGEDETRNKVFKSVHRQNACEKLAAIEDILGDEYDLDRLRELGQADREGRCVVLPVKPGDSVRFAKNPRAKNETVDAITIYSDGRMSFGFHEYGVKTEWVDRWSEDDACKYVPVESTETELRREQDE